MKIFLPVLLALFFFVGFAYADPFLTCDPQPGITKYKMSIAGIDSESNAKTDGSAWVDLANVPAGETNGELRAGGFWTLDGVPQGAFEWTNPTPFLLGRPSVQSPPSNLHLDAP